ncbi:MAG: ribokinase [Formosimonas sp.]
MSIVNFGSINIDHVYQVPHFVQPGETLSAQAYSKGLGGKGLNQSVALQRAGVVVLHVGCIGADDVWMREQLTQLQLKLDAIAPLDVATGHALIQVNDDGENCIVLCAGANHGLTTQMIDAALARPDVEWVLLQNETNLIGEIIEKSHAAGKKIAFNPAPCHAELAQLPLHLLDTLVVNEVEAAQLTGLSDVAAALTALRGQVKNVVLTMGGDGVRYVGEAGEFFVAAQKVEVVDTTAAGDTFIGYYLAGLMNGLGVPQALSQATQAAGITVSRMGASSAIPFIHELT